MGCRLITYVGPYLMLPKDFEWYDFDSIVSDGRGESGDDDAFCCLIPNQKLEGIEREMSVDPHGGGQDVAHINPATIVRESAALSRLAAPLFKYCDENDIEISEAWGVVPQWY